jgi:hypothetical protein
LGSDGVALGYRFRAIVSFIQPPPLHRTHRKEINPPMTVEQTTTIKWLWPVLHSLCWVLGFLMFLAGIVGLNADWNFWNWSGPKFDLFALGSILLAVCSLAGMIYLATRDSYRSARIVSAFVAVLFTINAISGLRAERLSLPEGMKSPAPEAVNEEPKGDFSGIGDAIGTAIISRRSPSPFWYRFWISAMSLVGAVAAAWGPIKHAAAILRERGAGGLVREAIHPVQAQAVVCVRCPKCRSLNGEAARFCNQCGFALTASES